MILIGSLWSLRTIGPISFFDEIEVQETVVIAEPIEAAGEVLPAKADIEPPKVEKPAVEPQKAPERVYSTSCESYRRLIGNYDWDEDTMMRIMFAESGCNPTNHNYTDNHRSCQGSFGLFQIGCIHGYTVDYLSVPENNISAAYTVWRSSGYNAWTTY